jgi:hypothetical protein
VNQTRYSHGKVNGQVSLNQTTHGYDVNGWITEFSYAVLTDPATGFDQDLLLLFLQMPGHPFQLLMQQTDFMNITNHAVL